MADNLSAEQRIETFSQRVSDIREELSRAIIGQQKIVDHLLISLFARGHCLLEGVPGLAKTRLIRSLSETLGLSFRRIQFTPDLMPGDITGSDIIDQDPATGKRSFRFVEGPVFANMILADEINRASPKTQSALLEGMQDQSITVGGATYPLESPFFVLATQNPMEQEGTFPLPEAQLDRFMFQLQLDYPSFEEETRIARETTSKESVPLNQRVDREQILQMQQWVRDIAVPEHLSEWAVRIVQSTRPGTSSSHKNVDTYVQWGAGPRASQYLLLGAKSRALASGRASIDRSDLNDVALPVLRHRIILNYRAKAEGIQEEDLIVPLLDHS
ncbi:MAG: MoxR family ATPase [Balneolaceae bacterium]